MNLRQLAAKRLGYKVGQHWARHIATKGELGRLRKFRISAESQQLHGVELPFRSPLPSDPYTIGEHFYFTITPIHNGDREAAQRFWPVIFESASVQADEMELADTTDEDFVQGFAEAAKEHFFCSAPISTAARNSLSIKG